MRKVRLIYNPVSGNASFRHVLDQVIECFQQRGLQVVPHRALGKESIAEAVCQMRGEEYYAIAAAGGDGTINAVINAMADAGVVTPLALIPAGTANDFAAHLGMPCDIDRISAMIAAGQYCTVDLGKANDRYFANVASAGLLTDVSHSIGIHFKNLFGKLAYYFKGVEQLPNFRPIAFQIESEEFSGEEELFLFLVLNGSCAGGFPHIVPARVDDGLLDVIAIRRCSLPQLVALLVKLLRGEHLNDQRILYFQTKAVTFRSVIPLTSDLDGEQGPELPIHIKTCSAMLRVFVEQ